MKSFIAIIFSIVLSGYTLARAQDMDTELSKVADKLASQIKDQGRKKVTVLDFTDLQGGSSELGKYVAEQLTVDLVISRKDFSVLDRANLKSILAEHKLAATGLIDPDTAKKIGQFSGVDAIILGTVTSKDQSVAITAKIITTDTAEIVGAAKATFTNDSTAQQLQSTPNTASGNAINTPDLKDNAPQVVKTNGNLRFEMQPVQIVNQRLYVLTMDIKNLSKKSVWFALSMDRDNNFLKGNVVDSNGSQFNSTWEGISGISYDREYQGYFQKATEIAPGDSATATIKFYSPVSKAPVTGVCNLQLEFLTGDDTSNGSARCTIHSITSKIGAQ
jgi:TolB-like protein